MVVFALIATVTLNALASGLVTLANTEAAIALNYRQAGELTYAAEAGASAAMADLSRMNSSYLWSTVLSGAVRSSSCDTTMMPMLASGERIDLTALTTALQAASDADARRGADNPRWRLYLYQPLAAIARTPTASSYVAVWVADDAAEADGDPQADSNGVITIRSQAFGPRGMQRTIDATLATDAAGMKLVSWRDVR